MCGFSCTADLPVYSFPKTSQFIFNSTKIHPYVILTTLSTVREFFKYWFQSKVDRSTGFCLLLQWWRHRANLIFPAGNSSGRAFFQCILLHDRHTFFHLFKSRKSMVLLTDPNHAAIFLTGDWENCSNWKCLLLEFSGKTFGGF